MTKWRFFVTVIWRSCILPVLRGTHRVVISVEPKSGDKIINVEFISPRKDHE